MTALGQGWTVISPDAIRAPDGSVFDIYFDYGGPQQRPQWTQISGPGNTPLGGAGGGTSGPGGAGGGGTGGAGAGDLYGDPEVGYGNNAATEIFLNEILSRMEELRNPIHDPYRDLYEQFSLDRIGSLGESGEGADEAFGRYENAALGRIQSLSGDPYTAGEDAALRARYMAPLTQARDTAQTAARERAAARGMMDSSGLLEDSLGEIEQGYERNVGMASNDLAVRAIDERQRRLDQQLGIHGDLLGEGRTNRAEGSAYADQQLSVLMDLLGEGRNTRAEEEARSVELLRTTGLLPELDERRLQLLLQASGEGAGSPGSIMSSLMGLGQLGLTQQQIAQNNKQNQSQAWGSMLPYLLQALGLGGG